MSSTLSHYRLTTKLGEGGMGEVYLAQDTKLDRKVALKLLPAGVANDPRRRRRFITEAKAASALNHPNVCTIYEVGEAEGHQLYLAMEYIEGQTLDEKLRQGPLEVKMILDLGLQIADALDAAHSRGIVHRDIKPSNVSVNHRGQVKVLDFGLAKRLTTEPSADANATTQLQTQEGQVMGTPNYMSPEQTLGKDIDHRSDLFNLGLVLYELTTGRPAFAGSNFSATRNKIVDAQPETIARFNRNAPLELDRIVQKCLEKDREDRYQSAKDLLVDLRQLKRTSDTQSPEAGPAARSRGRTNKARPLVWVVSAAAILAGGYFIWQSLTQPRGNGEFSKNRPAPPPPVAALDPHRLAVLPLENISPDPGDAYFADGLTEELISRLSKLSGLTVIPRASVMQYKGAGKGVTQIGKELQVGTLLEGSVRKSGDRLRITVQLIDVGSQAHLWSDDYNRELKDIFAVQSELAQQVAGALSVNLLRGEGGELTRQPTADLEAYELYLKGRYFWNRRTEDGFRRALQYFQDAIQRDPHYALPQAGMAYTYVLLGHELYALKSPHDSYPEAKAAALRALKLDETLAEARIVLASLLFRYDRDFKAAGREYERAIALNPKYATAHQWYSHYLLPLGREQESLAHSLRALELAPLSLIINMHLGWHYFYAGQNELAIRQFKKTLELEPRFIVASLFLGQAYEQARRYPDAILKLEECVRDSGRNPVHLAALAHAYAVAGRRGQAEKILHDVLELSKKQYVPSYEVAVIYAGLDQPAQALAWLEQAAKRRDSGWLVDVGLDPRFEPLRPHPRFKALLRHLGLEKA